MVDGRQLKKAIDKFMQSPVCLDARIQIELPNGEMYDLTTMTCLKIECLEVLRLIGLCSNVISLDLKWVRSSEWYRF